MTNQTISLTIPDIDSMSDDQLADFLHMRDGRWSRQTKDLLAKFGTSKLNLNRAWAGLWQSWTCPCCRRSKPQLARVNSAGVLLCQIEVHHDHLGDWAERKFSEVNPRTDDKQTNIQIDWCKHSTLELVVRFDATPICLDCNLVEGRAKAYLGKAVFPDFSFSPSEIAQFIVAEDNQVHNFDRGKVEEIWNSLNDDVDDRIDFTIRMAKRFANGKNRRQFDGRPAPEFWIDSAALFWRMLGKDSSVLSGSRVAEKLVARSTARDAVGRSATPKTRPPGKPPTDAEFDVINLQNADQKHWARFSEEWKCDCCGRSKRSICRRANSGKWTARIHVIRDWKLDEMTPDYSEEKVIGNFYIDDHMPAFICQDCRNVVSEMQRRDDALNEYSVTLGDIQGAISTIAANEMHEVDFDYLIDRAYENQGLQEAIASYQDLEGSARYYLERTHFIMKRHRCSFEDARGHLIHDHAKLLDKTIADATDHIDWYLARARKFESLREVELGRGPIV
ncbi:rubredoxin [Rhizobium sp. BK226]|uniref:hypothetical protein n=1 Tax=Rhizobium sp. BK226 TaxID=2587075 RepID=UPI001618CF24|nr:hypothetical protein [Rhizobium sp. BK226]MBB4116415.1 rubredoxin [Rhizobium sp. BK226]